MNPISQDRFRERGAIFQDGKYILQAGEGRPFERCVEDTWVEDKLKQCDLRSNDSLFDFGCNKASYILDAKKNFGIKTSGIDMKKEAKNFVDSFFLGEFDKKLKAKIKAAAPFTVCTGISSIEHAGNKWHPNEDKIRRYQIGICEFLIGISKVFLLTVPFGARPGWAKDKSRKNLYQFNKDMLEGLKKYADQNGKQYLEEVFKLDAGYWARSTAEECKDCRYRGKKQGATAVALISIWG